MSVRPSVRQPGRAERRRGPRPGISGRRQAEDCCWKPSPSFPASPQAGRPPPRPAAGEQAPPLPPLPSPPHSECLLPPAEVQGQQHPSTRLRCPPHPPISSALPLLRRVSRRPRSCPSFPRSFLIM
ncbi:hypothetical protein HJG60_009417 [Phyllostomus discolor]|uniref:Uncharacterized protein n=1 Tax=Phyllostomus discolor TaxID=89673 RepID=A0A833YLA3_9CHIR|nr:hypothetical protein HJG60_009417 [Phyllostomus discolor]